MNPVRRRDLLVLALGLALASWLLVRSWYGSLPALHWWLPAPLAVLAVAEALGTRTLRARLAVRRVEPLLVARLAVLAQASAYVGAVFTGVWLGVLAHVGPDAGRVRAAGADTVTAAIGIGCSLALVAAALWLESACRVPHDPSSSGRHRDQEPPP